MWKESNRNIVVIFQPNILRIVGFYVRHSELNQQIADKKAHHFLGLDQFLDILMSASEYKFVLQSIKHLEIVLNLENGVLSYSMWKLVIPLDGAYLPHLITLAY